jgi:serine/threonine protein kinase
MSAMLDIGQVVAARYALQRLLGRGPRGESWLARDSVAGRDVALKFAAVEAGPEGEEALGREQAIQALVAHPASLPAGRLESADGRTFLVNDYRPGGDLARLRGRAWPFVLRRVVAVVEALQALHDAGYVHGDIKSANVLLDADGLPQLADFSSARPISAQGPAEGSPYGMSPQRHAGEPATVADDVYAVGALLYELIGGHPPFYPDLSVARVRDEVPAPLVGRPAVPAPLADLVARCLAKEPARRPATMTELARQLQACLALPVTDDVSSPAGAAPRLVPPTEAAPIRTAWQRSTESGPSAQQLRSEGFRRGLMVSGALLSIAAVVFVFFVLPGLVEQPVPASAPKQAAATQAAQPAEAPLPAPQDFQQLAELKRQADEQRAALGKRLAALEKHDVAAWGGAALGEVRAALTAADDASTKRDFAAAMPSLHAAGAKLDALEKQQPVVLRQLLADGNAALDAGRSSDALQKFSAALAMDAGNAAAASGVKRAKVLDDVLKEMAAAARAEQDGDARGALAAYQRALALDPATRSAHEGIARLQARASGDAFAAAMSQGLSALARKDYPAARSAFESAGRIRPGAPEVAEALGQVDQAGRTRDISATLARARQAEKDERWAEALSAYRDALKADPTLVEGQQGADRCDPRAMLDAQLQTFIDHPERLFSQEGRGAARALLANARDAAPSGPRLNGQVARVGDLVQQAETPIRVALDSDNATDVQIYRVGRLGAFDHRDVELMPGRYTVVGTRSGFRDVRREIKLLPGMPPPVLVIRCEEPI